MGHGASGYGKSPADPHKHSGLEQINLCGFNRGVGVEVTYESALSVHPFGSDTTEKRQALLGGRLGMMPFEGWSTSDSDTDFPADLELAN